MFEMLRKLEKLQLLFLVFVTNVVSVVNVRTVIHINFICSDEGMVRCCNVCCKRQSLVDSQQSLVKGRRPICGKSSKFCKSGKCERDFLAIRRLARLVSRL